jgi:hypothetical protein
MLFCEGEMKATEMIEKDGAERMTYPRLITQDGRHAVEIGPAIFISWSCDEDKWSVTISAPNAPGGIDVRKVTVEQVEALH